MLNALENARCQIIHRPLPETAPFRITYQAPSGERAGISIEFNDAAVQEIVARGWHVWERDGGVDKDRPVEILVGGTADSLLHNLAFERTAQMTRP